MIDKYLFANLWLFEIGECSKTTSYSFATTNEAINAPSASLEVLITTCHKRGGWEWEHFANVKWLPICQSFLLYKWRGTRGIVSPVSNCKCNDELFQCVSRSAYCKLFPQVALQRRPLFNGNQATDCWQIVVFLHQWQVGNSAILCVDWHLQCIVVSSHLSLDAHDVYF